MLSDAVAYEVTVARSDQDRDRFVAWFPSVVLDWSTQPEVRSFRVYHGVDGVGGQFRLVFTFASEAAWERFVRRPAHRERMARLEGLASAVRTALWTPGAVRLVGDDPVIVGIDDRAGDAERQDGGSTPDG